MTSIKELFSLLTVKQLRELAYKHNVEVIIKSPSTMLKAELVQAMTDHYSNLVGTDLIPIPQKPLKMNRLDIPPQFQEKEPKKAQSLKDKELLAAMLEQYKERGIGLNKPQLYKLKQEQAEKRAAKYRTKEKLDDSIQRRKARAEKAKQARLAKKAEKGEQEEKTKDLTPGEKLAESLKVIAKRAEQLRTMKAGAAGIKLYNEVQSMKDNIQDKAKAMKKEGTLKKKEEESIYDEIDTINEILDDDDIIDKFYVD